MSDTRALDLTHPGWRFVQRRVVLAARHLRELEDWELSAYVAQIKPVDLVTLRALSGSDWACAYEWNAALAQRALVAPLMAATQVDVDVMQRPGGR